MLDRRQPHVSILGFLAASLTYLAVFGLGLFHTHT